MTALQSGNLGAAQKAFATLTVAGNIASSDSNSPLAQIVKALQSGDLAAARQVAKAWQAQRSASHIELMLTEEGPRLIEINPRLIGA